ncbi:MAG TPA: tetratricopeptide repeat protein [Kofleriaceae bacterium]|nr:tetratricopeptide repeat protein [Kofleriaceae bacterium]
MPETRASSASPDRFEQHLVAGGDLLRRNEVAAARVELAAALEVRPHDIKALGLFGLACFRQSAFDDALPVYQKLVELRPDDASHRLNLGLVYLKVGQPDRSLAELGRSRELDPSQQRTMTYLGLAHARRGDYTEAFEAFLRAGEEQLALEMEQYLSDEDRAGIRARVRGSDARRARHAEVGLDSDVYETVERRPALIVPDGGADAHDDDADADDLDLSDDGAVEEFDDVGVITKAVALAVPSAAAAAAGTRVGVGQEAPRPLTALATRQLIRPEDGDHPFEIGAGGVLIVRVGERILSRTEDVIVLCGDLRTEPATRRVRGATSAERFAEPDRPGQAASTMSIVSGRGYMVVAPAGQTFAAVALDDDILYLRESMVYAFEEALRWETGHVPGAEGELRPLLRVVQFRGHGCVALRSKRPLLSLKLTSDRSVRVDARVLAGWIGRVLPRVVSLSPAGGQGAAAFVECSGEGVVLLEDQGGA